MWSEPVCYQVRAAQTCLRQVGNQVCDLDSVVDFSIASRRPAHESVRDPGRQLSSVIEFDKFHYAIQLANQLASWF